jgi:restriction system protein
MSRKRTSLLDDIFDLLFKSPWWLGVAFAAAFWIGSVFVGHPDPKAETLTKAMAPLFKMFLRFLAFISLVAAAFSAFKQLSRRRLLDRQTDLDSLRNLSWREFEQLVGEAYRRQGYDVEETGGGGADGGIDLVLRGHGETVLVQCKQWRVLQVGVDKVRELFGVLTAEGATRGILVTSGNFTNDAKSFKVGKPLNLVDGLALSALVHEVRTSTTTPTRPLPSPPAINQNPNTPSCPKCNAPMTLRTARRGANAGNSFYGCTRYPDCKGIRDA